MPSRSEEEQAAKNAAAEQMIQEFASIQDFKKLFNLTDHDEIKNNNNNNINLYKQQLLQKYNKPDSSKKLDLKQMQFLSALVIKEAGQTAKIDDAVLNMVLTGISDKHNQDQSPTYLPSGGRAPTKSVFNPGWCDTPPAPSETGFNPEVTTEAVAALLQPLASGGRDSDYNVWDPEAAEASLRQAGNSETGAAAINKPLRPKPKHKHN